MFNAITKMFVDAKIRLTREETGATAVEYGLIVGLIAVAVVAVLLVLGPQIAGMFTKVSDSLPD